MHWLLLPQPLRVMRLELTLLELSMPSVRALRRSPMQQLPRPLRRSKRRVKRRRLLLLALLRRPLRLNTRRPSKVRSWTPSAPNASV